MYLTKLLLRDFGKFHNEEINLQPGINLIEGKEGSGKSTIREFITGIIYGMRKQSGENPNRRAYDSLRPEGRSRYSGTGYAKQGDQTYLIDRSFLAGAKKTSVLDVRTGREMNLKKPDSLYGTVLETDKNTYQDTYVIADTEGRAAEELTTYLGNKIQTGSGSLDRAKAIAFLKAEQKKHSPQPLVRRLDDLSEKLEKYDDVDEALEQNKKALRQLTDDFAIEAAKRKRVARQLVENEDGTVSYKNDEELDKRLDRLTESQNSYGASELEDDQEKKKKLTDNFIVILLTGVLVIGIIAAIVYLLPFDDAVRKLFVIFTALFVIITMLDGFRAKGYFDDEDVTVPTEDDFNRVLEELEEENEKKEEAEFDMTFAKEYSAKKDELKAEESRLLDRKIKRDKLKKEFQQVFKKKSELEEELHSIHLAISTIEGLSRKYQEQAAKTFIPYISEYVEPLTGGRFNEIRFNAGEGLVVEGAGGSFALDVLPEDLANRVYLAVRLSIAARMSEEKLPLVIDDIVDFQGEADARAFLDVLSGISTEQIVLLTSNAYIRRAMDAEHMAYNHVSL